MTEPGSRRRRTLLAVLRTTVPFVVLAGVIALLMYSLQDNDSLASVLSCIAAVITLYFTAFDRLRRQNPAPTVADAVEDLRLRLLQQWEPELHRRVRGFPDERTIPLDWRKYRASGPSPLDGRFEGDPDRAAASLAQRFDQPVGKKRMIVLGEPGAGKTFVAIALAVGLLRRWTGDHPVAVYLSLSSWDPVRDGLDRWMVHKIANSYYAGDHSTPEKLFRARKLLPVLDGLDELPEHFRRRAVQRINEMLTGDRMLVVTCRTVEYEETVAGSAPVLLNAPAVEVLPVQPGDLLAGLAEVPAWAAVAEHVRSRPAGPLAAALTTPLMLSLFTSTYLERDPSALMDKTRFPTKHTVEDHLVDLRLESAYPAEAPGGGWTSKQARKWLTYLAQHMHHHDDREITWRKLAYRTVRPMAPLLVGALVGYGLLLVAFVAVPRVLPPPMNALESLYVGGIVTAAWLGYRHRTVDGTRPKRRLRGFRGGMAVGFTAVGAAALAAGAPKEDFAFSTAQDLTSISVLVFVTIGSAVACGLGVGLHEMLVDRSVAGRTTRAERDELKRERRSTFVAAAASGSVIGVLGVLLAVVSSPFGHYFGQRLAGAFGLPRVTDLALPSLEVYLNSPADAGWLVLTGVPFAAAFAAMLASTRAWPRFLTARVKLACLGRLPWRLHAFERDATDRGLLRRAGTAHQFGHRLLQDRLVTTSADQPPPRRRPLLRIVVTGGAALVLVCSAVVAWTGRPADCRTADRFGERAPMARVTVGQNTACFAYIPPQEWTPHLQRTKADAAVLAAIRDKVPDEGVLRSAPELEHVVVVGEFGMIEPAEWHDILVGISTAQRLSRRPVAITFVHADLEGRTGPASVELFDLYMTEEDSHPWHYQRWNTPYLVVDLNIVSSRLVGRDGSRSSVIAFRDADLTGRAREVANRRLSQWLNPSQGDLSPEALVDGVKGDLCSDLEFARKSSMVFDLRTAPPTPQFLQQMAACGTVSVLVDRADALRLGALPDRPKEVQISYLSDLFATIDADCRKALGLDENTTTDGLKACVAVIAANERFRVTVERIPDPLPR
ncbi:hypothetical protein [Lentzea sp. NBRC 102530]|uniref:NACHT domain-containing protein n=1 Tax=Lentzea sp. NBRC 102530 TaxID=3032201 RepID=UPI0024A5F837|nr:hypothetical protein [Lentzea sp. NBRC 102530]GLY54056.1 hypothetical protein Lesp01_77120 [Lentzea sp. NBRC 102530]